MKAQKETENGGIFMYDVIALGELLIDFTGGQVSDRGDPLFAANPGGAPCNVLAMLSRLGKRTAFVGKVGQDLFGEMLGKTLSQVEIEGKFLIKDPTAHTTLAFVHNTPDGDRSFSFYRDPGADELLTQAELPTEALQHTRIFHFGSLSLTREPVRTATKTALELSRQGGAMISFDPNLRPSLWSSLEEAKDQMCWGCSVCDVLKVAEEELAFLTGCDDREAGVRSLQNTYPDLRLILVTLGKRGSMAALGDLRVTCPTYLQVPAVDATGAGDTFCGCCLGYLLDHDLEALNEADLLEMLLFANAAASLVTGRPGAIRSMPSPQEVRALMAEGRFGDD
jgi:fructokinase